MAPPADVGARRLRRVPAHVAAGREAVGQVGLDGGDLLLDLGAAGGEGGAGHVHLRLVGVVEERHELVILAVRDRVVLVRVALGAADRQAEPDGAGGADAVDHGVEAELQRVDAAFLVEHRVAVKAGGDALLDAWRRAACRRRVARW